MSTGSEDAVLGQKLAFATASLLMGLATFVNLLGLEKATLAVAFGVLALRSAPAPRLPVRRTFALVGIALGTLMWVTVPTMLLIFRERLTALVDTLSKLP